MKLCSAAYLPRPDWQCAKAFVENLAKFPAVHDLLTFSEHPWPGAIPLRRNPEELRNSRLRDGQVNPFAINNALWLTAVQIAISKGYTHMLYLEADCRVAVPGWDDIIFDEFFSVGRPLIAGGTLIVYNPCAAGEKARLRWEELVGRNHSKNFPTPTYGWMGAANPGPSCVFPNGALAVYDLGWVDRLMGISLAAAEGRIGDVAATGTAFDKRFGEVIWDMWKEESYDVLASLTKAFSGYGEVVTTADQRKEMLRTGRYIAIHQIKDQWQPE